MPKLTEPTSHISMIKKTRKAFFRSEVRRMYKNTCAVCAKIRFSKLKTPEVEAAHIYPKRKNGSDDLRNGIALCKLHHWALDNGLFSIKDDFSIAVEDRIRSDENYEEIYRFNGRKITLPESNTPYPHVIYLKAHREIHNFE